MRIGYQRILRLQCIGITVNQSGNLCNLKNVEKRVVNMVKVNFFKTY